MTIEVFTAYRSDDGSPRYSCSVCHIPYKPSTSPFPIHLSQCSICR